MPLFTVPSALRLSVALPRRQPSYIMQQRFMITALKYGHIIFSDADIPALQMFGR